MAKEKLKDYWVDGHFISAYSEEEAVNETARLYDYRPETVRPWTQEDQDDLDWAYAQHMM